MFYEFRKFYCPECNKMIYVEDPERVVYGLRCCPFCGAEEPLVQGILAFPKDTSVELTPKSTSA